MLCKPLMWAIARKDDDLQLDIANILSALRGPDVATVSLKLKSRFTVPIRCWVYARKPVELFALGSAVGCAAPETEQGWRGLLEGALEIEEDSHIKGHLRYAISSIMRVTHAWNQREEE